MVAGGVEKSLEEPPPHTDYGFWASIRISGGGPGVGGKGRQVGEAN